MRKLLQSLATHEASNPQKATATPPQVSTELSSNAARGNKKIEALLASCTVQDLVVPPLSWHERYGDGASVGPEGATALYQHLLEHENLWGREDAWPITLCLHGMEVGDTGLDEFFPLISRVDRVKSVILSGNNLTAVGVQRLLWGLLKRQQPLEIIDLTDNPITLAGVLDVLYFCSNALQSPVELSIGRFMQPGKATRQEERAMSREIVMELLKEGLVHLFGNNEDTELRYFTYNGASVDEFDSGTFAAILQAAIAQSSIRHVSLRDCYTTIPREGSREWEYDALAKPFSTAALKLRSCQTKLQSLELTLPISDTAAAALATGIAGATFLKHLSLRNCSLSARALSYIGEALAENQTLISLNLSHQFPSTEVHPVHDGICHNNKKDTHACDNENDKRCPSMISSQPLLPVARALHKNHTLQILKVVGTRFTDKDVEEVCRSIECGGNSVISQVIHTGVLPVSLEAKMSSLLLQNASKNPVSDLIEVPSESVLAGHRRDGTRTSDGGRKAAPELGSPLTPMTLPQISSDASEKQATRKKVSRRGRRSDATMSNRNSSQGDRRAGGNRRNSAYVRSAGLSPLIAGRRNSKWLPNLGSPTVS
uniref:WGS project CAEQ00000000 data, annotated contig 1577 n=1 Tax=Trypanosoma congolense (strain IL3000) TaxID=1068625 RepID=F9W775_TRYCI|nr:unnamed protein product [Trypanosoma congolense IL3000]